MLENLKAGGSRSRPHSQSEVCGICGGFAMIPVVVGFASPPSAASKSSSGTPASACQREDWDLLTPKSDKVCVVSPGADAMLEKSNLDGDAVWKQSCTRARRATRRRRAVAGLVFARC